MLYCVNAHHQGRSEIIQTVGHTIIQALHHHALPNCITPKHPSNQTSLAEYIISPSPPVLDLNPPYIMRRGIHHEQADCQGRVRLPVAVTPQSNNYARRRVHVPMWLILVWSLVALITPAAALDEPHALSAATAGRHYEYHLPIGFFITFLLFIGRAVAAFSKTLVGPAMGITSVLWLMMRNDSAISPKASWM